ncbi:hypothetical protein [Microbulbifer spongiae]|uniref:Uncharacterized protein n=1 Tax=Microbulbifer spongiae TaxID=2944933 RepID=A0ABY9EAE7_9GAMM|nr:hypothetical protein [Microbulbifer sp. MI-G]WKD49435.1 hypothetical protein M8T91_16300 [Microbulbifer sp. MI-G]
MVAKFRIVTCDTLVLAGLDFSMAQVSLASAEMVLWGISRGGVQTLYRK